uniref:Uncharacterized protein n=1 Tax=Anguilla anguilla TaxID=7936 RepID=A0A0E9WB43_ANGAN
MINPERNLPVCCMWTLCTAPPPPSPPLLMCSNSSNWPKRRNWRMPVLA